MLRTRPGFTLVELLVVVTIIVALLAMIAPAMDKAIDQALRVRCASQQKAITGILFTYASSHRGRFPLPRRACGGDATYYMNDATVTIFKESAGYRRTTPRATGTSSATDGGGKPIYWGIVPEILIDPSYGYFGFYSESCEWVIGYAYLTNVPLLTDVNSRTPPEPGDTEWASPVSLSRPGTGEMLACHNTWWTNTWVAHLEVGGPLGADTPSGTYFNTPSDPDPRANGAAGGNIARTDGSVTWTDIDRMHKRYAYSGTSSLAAYGRW